MMVHKARTRTLIQIGSLVNIAGLLDFCGIELGEDLSATIHKKDKAAIVIGLLKAILKNTHLEITQEKLVD